MSSAYKTLVLDTLSQVDSLLIHYVYDGYQAFSTYLQVPLGILSAIAITLLGYSVSIGWVRLSIPNLVKAVLKIGLIYMAVMDWGFVSQYLVGFVNDLVGGLGDALITASPVHIKGVNGLDGALQTVLTVFTQMGMKVFGIGGLNNMGPWLSGILIWGFGYLFVGIGLFEIILAKVMLSVLFVFTPVIVLFCYFRTFHGIFDRWLGSIVGFALLQLFVTAALTLSVSIAYWWIEKNILGSKATDIGNAGTWPVVIIGITSIGLILKAAHLAQNLGGSVSSASASSLVGGMIGGAIGASIPMTQTGMKMSQTAWDRTGGMAARGFKSGAASLMKSIRSSMQKGEGV
jgi:type IV secretory pathway VirB6-like protein